MTSLLFLAFIARFFFSGLMKRIDYSKQICLAHPLSFECFHNSFLYFYWFLSYYGSIFLSSFLIIISGVLSGWLKWMKSNWILVIVLFYFGAKEISFKIVLMSFRIYNLGS